MSTEGVYPFPGRHPRSRTAMRAVPTSQNPLFSQPGPRIFDPRLDQTLAHRIVDDVFRHPLDALFPAKDVIVESPLPETPLQAEGPGQQGASALETADPHREGKPFVRQLDEEVAMVRHETPRMENNAVDFGVAA